MGASGARAPVVQQPWLYKNKNWKLSMKGFVRVCGDEVLLDSWCGFAEIFILSCCIAVLKKQAVCGI